MTTVASSHYETLGTGPDASAEEVKAAYIRLVKVVHPDHGGSPALFRAVREAFEELSDPARRAAYDASLAGAGDSASHAAELPADAGYQGPSAAGAQGGAWPPGHDWGAGPPYGQRGDCGGQTASRTSAPTGNPGAARPPRVVRRRPFYQEHPASSLCLLGMVACIVGWRLLSTKGADGAQLMGERALTLGGVALVLGIAAALGWAVISASTAGQAQAGPAVLSELSTPDVVGLLGELFTSYGYGVWLLGEPQPDRAGFCLQRYDQRAVVVLRRCAYPLGPEAVYEAMGAMRSHQVDTVALIATSGFAEGATNAGNECGAQLSDSDEVVARLVSAGFNVTAERVLPQRSYGLRLLCSELRYGVPVVLRFLLFVALFLVCVLGALAEAAPLHCP